MESSRLVELERTWPVQPQQPKALWMIPEEKLKEIEQQKAKVFTTIDSMRDEAVSFFQELIRIPSVNPSEKFEKELADFVASKMKSLGMEVRRIEPAKNRVSNWSLLKGSSSKRTLMFYSHLDTVPAGDLNLWKYPPFDAKIVEGKIIGRGSKDCKLGIASSLMAVEAIQKAGIDLGGDLMVLTCADEETGGQLGIAKMIDTGWVKADFCIYGEGVPDKLTIGARGFCQLRITTRGKSTHTARKELGINAIVKMARVIPAIDSMVFTRWSPHPIVQGKPVASVNMINGGMKENVVADSCSIVVDIRFPPGMTVQDVMSDVERVLDSLKASDPYLGGLDVSIEPVSVGRPVCISPDEPIVKILGCAVKEVLRIEPQAVGMMASSDSRWIVHDAGIPTVNYSMGNESGHQPNEYVIVDRYIENIKVYALTSLLCLL